jgi:hypothetical protein
MSAVLPSQSLATSTPRAAAADQRHLVGPLVDFLCLGGISLVLFPIAVLVPHDWSPTVAVATMLVANLVNHPHFAHSYQIFYRGLFAKLRDETLPRELRARYVFAGFIAPLALAGFLGAGLAMQDLALLGLGANAMAFLVGWHYVKQGYGILMVDAVLKRRFFQPGEKKILLVNAYVVWLMSWMTVNALLSERNLWGIEYVLLGIPWPLVWAGWAAAGATSLAVLAMLRARLARKDGVAWTGVLAYVVSIYLWLAFVRLDPVWLLVVPALHSLQYLVVVWRFETNRARAAADAMEPSGIPILGRILRAKYQARLAGFAVLGIVLGFLLFWGIPVALDTIIKFPQETGRAFVFLFSFWVFVNVHHYFTDNVIWRSQNPETRRYLFG